MIKFMVIAAPRSGTAWAANWLTTEKTLCLHDQMFVRSLEDLDALPCDRMLGIADSGIALFPRWVNAHSARKVILHRDVKEINDSLKRAGLPQLDSVWAGVLNQIDGMHVDWRVLFDHPGIVHNYLFGSNDYDAVRHDALRTPNVQLDFEKVDPDPNVTKKLLERMRGDVR